MAETCDICEISGNDVRLFDAIYQGKMASLCERCSIIENIPLIKKPNAEQLKESETLRVSDKMKYLSGLETNKKEETFFQEDKLKELDKNPELELPEKHSLNLIEHFHWEVMKNRRRKGLSQQQLAETIGESETSIQFIEKAELPENAEVLIKKLEQFFQIKLRDIKEPEPVKEPILTDEKGKEIEIIPEEEMVFIEDTPEAEPISRGDTSKKPLGVLDEEKELDLGGVYLPSDQDLDLKKIDREKITIGDLQKLHEKREEATKQEQIEEQKKIEERQIILEALREKDRLKLEERKKQDLIEKQQSEEARQKLIEQKKQELEETKKREAQDVDKYLGGTELLNEDTKNNKEKQDLDSKNVKEFDDELF